METTPLNPWFSMWWHPRRTIRQIVATDPDRLVLLLAAAHALAGAGANDDDGASNDQEYRAGTDPADPASAFRIASLTATDLVWSAVFGKTYALEVSGDQGASWNGWTTNAAPTNFPESLVQAPRPAVSSGWYRVRIVP